MCNLLRSGFFRYTHSTVFKVCFALTFLFGALFSYGIFDDAEINELWFMFGTVVFGVLIAFMIGTETSKCIRNKITTGYTKTQIYFSELILANIFMILLFSIYLLLSIALNFRLLWHIPLRLALQTVFGFLCMSLLFTNVFASLTCVISSKTVSAIVCLVLSIALYMTSSVVVEMLNQNEFFNVAYRVEGGEWEYSKEKNPNYVDEPLRSVLTLYREANPYGQPSEYNRILLPFLFDDEAWEKAKKATADTIGNDFLKREVSESEQEFLNKKPYEIIAPIPFIVLAGWLLFRKKSFR